ncbi:hypothetical protein GCM10010193_39540 [Kitasatospora atroaurantiaca]|uniref:CdaR family transcriptional regulator n=1 Tax=Kitasatospora atroaurantiaca TaxID=285545 RepID=A0A561EMM1_9ACTN|nr:helix-turn-helix domain-containing protein [Kitasatospora atroaurantiaca]TWE16868.1 CdaR family transcriptional regulator [Kitasatospora atroaurantiaca]
MGRRERERVRQELAGDPGVVTVMVEAVHAQVPAYAALDDSRLPEIGSIAGWALGRILDFWVTDSALDEADLRRLRGIAAARAADGRPLQAVLRAYRVAAAAIAEVIEECRGRQGAGRQLDGADIFALTRVLLTTLDTISEVMTTAYAAASESLTGDRARALQSLLDDLIAGRQASAAALADRSGRLGIQLPDPYCLLVAEPSTQESAPELSAAELLEALAPARTDGGATALATVRGPRLVLLLPAAAADLAPAALRARALRGCAITGESLDRIAAAHRLATDALDTAPAHAHHPDRVLTDADAHVLGLLAGRATLTPDRIARIVLGPLADPARRHLLDALAAYLDAGTASAGARSLHLHPQSMRYRLRRVRELTGRDPRDPWQRLTLDIARTLGHRLGLPES